jgi:predicted glutamine amidotransferase
MLGYAAAEPASAAHALGDRLLSEFAALARLHADGWGTAWLDPDSGAVLCLAGADATVGGPAWTAALSAPSSARMVYLRFASRGAPAAPDNGQPFHRDGAAFQHNGLLAPREDLLDLLDPAERSRLRGTTDSEAYFAVVRGSARTTEPGFAHWSASTIAHSVAQVRARFPAACLNAMLVTESGLRVVHAAGTARVPLEAFADRGTDLAALPPGHDDDYNALFTTATGDGVQIVATTGVDQRGWTPLSNDMVFEVTYDKIVGVAINPEGLRPPPAET